MAALGVASSAALTWEDIDKSLGQALKAQKEDSELVLKARKEGSVRGTQGTSGSQ